MVAEIVLGGFVVGYGALALLLFVSAGRQLVKIRPRKQR